MSGSAYLLERAWVDGAVHDEVLVEIEDGRFTAVLLGQSSGFSGSAMPENPEDPRFTGDPRPRPTRLAGLTLPGFANGHSHAFHRALRGRTERGRGTFWTWREQMYAVAAALDPDTWLALARATYREMAAAGYTTVGEFHYLHHQPDGTPYDEPNVMGLALIEAADEAGIRIALLDTCYVSGGFGAPVAGAQVRYDDGDAERWAARVAALAEPEHVRVGSAIHSVRAVPREQLETVVDAASGRPLHLHLSEQPAENDACRAAYGATPTQVLADAGVLGPDTTAVHATHLTPTDVALLGGTRTTVCLCPTTERDLADGVGPARALRAAGARPSLGSDSHAVIDPFEEMRALELDERLVTRTRGHWPAADLLAAGARHDSLGFPDAGRIAVGARADLVTLDTASVRTAGTGADEHTAVYAAGAADVTSVVADGRVVAGPGEQAEIGRELAAAVAAVLRRVR
ncbi:formimidoylglutamate deiminase [Nocardioides pantholopis]|uniref:formimidoylglutamate deiminase n=1 Tax=Nocardioides pantholopis TaxID=2483798 RepID=UPI000F079794|nr:formimidoylglutamate deiminase [Nocardioides pantholopis]